MALMGLSEADEGPHDNVAETLLSVRMSKRRNKIFFGESKFCRICP